MSEWPGTEWQATRRRPSLFSLVFAKSDLYRVYFSYTSFGHLDEIDTRPYALACRVHGAVSEHAPGWVRLVLAVLPLNADFDKFPFTF